MELITTIYQVLFPSYLYFSSIFFVFQTSIQPELIFSDSKLFCVKGSFQSQHFPTCQFSFKEKNPLHFYSFCFQMIKENQQSYLNPNIKYSHALLNHRDTFWEKHHWGILWCKRHRVHLHKPRWYSPLHTPRLHGIPPVVSSVCHGLKHHYVDGWLNNK